MGQFQDCANEPAVEKKYGGHVFKLYLDVSHISICEGRLGMCGRLVLWLQHAELTGQEGQESSIRFTRNVVKLALEMWFLEEGAKGKAYGIHRLGLQVLTPQQVPVRVADVCSGRVPQQGTWLVGGGQQTSTANVHVRAPWWSERTFLHRQFSGEHVTDNRNLRAERE